MPDISMGSLRQATLACAVFMFADRAVSVCAVVNSISARGIVSIKFLHPAALALAPLLQGSGRWPDESALARVSTPSGAGVQRGRRPGVGCGCDVPVFVSSCS